MNRAPRTMLAFVCAAVMLAGVQAEAQSEFKGKIGKSLADSEEYWPEPVRPPQEAPNVLIWLKNKSHEFIAEVDIPAGGGDGMLVTAGGRTGGYGLFIKNGRLTYVYNYIGIERTMLISTEEVPYGKSQLRMKFTKTGDFVGDAELFINDESVGKTHIAKTVPITYSIEETFDVGEDTGSPIIEDVYAVPFRNEALQKLTVKVGSD